MCVCVNGGTAVAQAQPELPKLRVERPIAFHPEMSSPPTDRLHPDSARPGDIGRPVAFRSPLVCSTETHRNLEIHIRERRWCVVGDSEIISHDPKIIAKGLARVLRSEPHFHDVDGACQWRFVIQKVWERLSDIDPKFTAEQWPEQLQLGSNEVRFETCWYKSDDSTPSSVFSNY